MNPLIGTWVANIDKSRRHANHLFHAASLTVEAAGDAIRLTHSGVNASGKQESGTTTLVPDGLEHPASPDAPGVMMLTTWTTPYTLETQARKDGQVLGKGTYAVSADGRTLTATVAGIDGAGKAFDHVIVFDRES